MAGLMADYQSRIDALKQDLEGKQVLLSMFNNKALNLLSSQSQLNLITNDLGAINLADQTGQEAQASHGQEASWETILEMNPEYLFVLDRTAATGNESTAKEVIENDLIKDLAAYKEGKIVYFIDHANVWYTATGGIQALDTMLSDLETALKK